MQKRGQGDMPKKCPVNIADKVFNNDIWAEKKCNNKLFLKGN